MATAPLPPWQRAPWRRQPGQRQPGGDARAARSSDSAQPCDQTLADRRPACKRGIARSEHAAPPQAG